MSEIEEEPVNLFTIVLAPPGAGKSAAFKAGIENPIVSLEESIDRPILVEDFTRSGVFLHLKTTEGLGVFAKDEVHILLEKMVSNSQNKNVDKDLLIKFFDNAQWSVNKGNSSKREHIVQTGMPGWNPCKPYTEDAPVVKHHAKVTTACQTLPSPFINDSKKILN